MPTFLLQQRKPTWKFKGSNQSRFSFSKLISSLIHTKRALQNQSGCIRVFTVGCFVVSAYHCLLNLVVDCHDARTRGTAGESRGEAINAQFRATAVQSTQQSESELKLRNETQSSQNKGKLAARDMWVDGSGKHGAGGRGAHDGVQSPNKTAKKKGADPCLGQ